MSEWYLFKVNNGHTGTMCQICLKLTIETPHQHHQSRNQNNSGVFIVENTI